MADKKTQPEKGVVTKGSRAEAKKGHQPLSQDSDAAGNGILGGLLRINSGHQPEKGTLDVSNPPKGGSGVPKAPAGDGSSDKKE